MVPKPVGLKPPCGNRLLPASIAVGTPKAPPAAFPTPIPKEATRTTLKAYLSISSSG
ncbi:MAG: hypothetical protein RLZZ135_317 [Cyanobacteriota bacterium]|jgi:hypothetical protein